MPRLMYILFFVFSTLVLLNCSEKPKQPESVTASSSPLQLGHVDSLHSSILNESRQIYVHIPESFATSEIEELSYPVVYLLDGSIQFHTVSTMMRYMSSSMNSKFPETVVIGITNTNRSRDLTPTQGESILPDGRRFPIPSGGGADFLDFVEKELIPYVEKKYPTTDNRTIVGHSLGGLSVLQALTTRPNLFDNYLVIDGSLWWNDQDYISEVYSMLSKGTYENKWLYVAIANNLLGKQTLEEALVDSSQASLPMRANFEFAQSLENLDNGLNIDWKYYESEGHGSVPFIAQYEAMQFFYKWYEFPIEQLLEPGYDTTPGRFIDKINGHFELVSEKMGYEVLPKGDLVNTFGLTAYTYLMDFELAHALFDLNIQNYPDAPKVYEAKADCYSAEQKNEEAIKFYKKAISFKENATIKLKLDALQQRKDKEN